MILATQEQDGAVLRLVLSRPKANILDAAMIQAISAELDQVTARCALIVFEGAGSHFCFGASVAEHQREQAAGMLQAFHDLFRKLADLAVPTCAVVRGQCLGGGLELASWCTWIVAEPGAHFGQPEVKLAVFPPMASVLLPWRCGGGAALDLCVGGASIDAEEAHRIGLVSAVTADPEAWLTELVQRRLAVTSASSLRFTERALRVGLMVQLSQQLPVLERLYLDHLMATHDANEGIAAFLERRPPNFIHS